MSMHIVQELWDAVEKGEVPARLLVETAKNHFLSLCPVCAEEFEEFRRAQQGKPKGDPGLQATSAVLEEHVLRIQVEERQASRDLEEILALPWEARTAKVRRSRRRFRGSAFVHALLEEYWQAIHEDPSEAFRYAELAWEVARQSSTLQRPCELLVLAEACMGNAARVSGDLRSADRIFRNVRHFLNTEDVRSPAVLAKVDHLEASLRKDQRRLSCAVELLNRAAVLHRIAGSRVELARVLMTLSETYYAKGRMRIALQKIRAALALIERRGEPRLRLWAQHNLALYLSEMGDFAEAARILAASEKLYAAHATPLNLFHRSWLQGRVAAGLGDESAAETALLAARAGFMSLSIAYDAALISLDLAMLYLPQGRLSEVRELAETIIPIFGTHEIHREAVAALLLFRDAARKEAVTASFARKVSKYLLKARVCPSMSFDPGALEDP